jgi:hypothetical protein
VFNFANGLAKQAVNVRHDFLLRMTRLSGTVTLLERPHRPRRLRSLKFLAGGTTAMKLSRQH